MKSVRVLVADGDPAGRAALRTTFAATNGVTVVGEACDGAEALRLATVLRPDVTLVDHGLPILSAVPAIGAHSRVVVLTRGAPEHAVLRTGAVGCLVHGQYRPADLTRAVLAAARLPARFGLSPRERDVAHLIADGLTNTEIAAHLALAPKTVENHVNHVYAKLGVTDRRQAIARWRSDGRDP